MHKIRFSKKDVLVMIGAIAFVLANLGAVGANSRRRAKEAVCLSNLLQWGRIWKSYADDHDGYFPQRGGSVVWGHETMGAWPYLIREYGADLRRTLMLCPEATKPYDQGGMPPFAAWSYEEDSVRITASYTANLWVAREASGTIFWGTPHIAGAGNVPVFSDGIWKDTEPQPYDEPPAYEDSWWEPNANEMKRVCVNRHNGALNGVLMDFSVRKIGLKELWLLKWHRQWPEGNDHLPIWPAWMQNFEDY